MGGEGVAIVPGDFWTLVQQVGLPIAMLLVFVYAIYRKIFVPGWYALHLEERIKVLETKNDELTKKSFELASLARTGVEVARAVMQKEAA